ncbi:MAG: HicB family protein [Flavipsychrobacter sp.]|jgi:predicted RNase H-like HicB family nuclease|nr:HicB family protein [Flavipsychrobacter sp.]
MMKQVKIVIERSSDLFSSYAENVEGIYGGGDTVQEAKKSILDAIKFLKKHNKAEHIPAILKGDYQLVFKFDVQSFLDYYKGVFTPAALERIAGINQKQIQHYSTGHRKPRLAQRRKIEEALHKLGQELIAVEL